MPKTKPPYPVQFRQQIIELARAGRTPAQLSREFGPSAQSIANWIAQDMRDRGTPLSGKESSIQSSELIKMAPAYPLRFQERHIVIPNIQLSVPAAGFQLRESKVRWTASFNDNFRGHGPTSLLNFGVYE